MSAPGEARGEDAEMLAKWREVREQIAADEADAAAKALELHSEQAGHRADLQRLAEVQKEITDADEQAAPLDQRAAAALEARDALGRESGVATKDALRLQASLLGMQGEASEIEGQLAWFRRKAAAELVKVRQHLSDVGKLIQDKAT